MPIARISEWGPTEYWGYLRPKDHRNDSGSNDRMQQADLRHDIHIALPIPLVASIGILQTNNS